MVILRITCVIFTSFLLCSVYGDLNSNDDDVQTCENLCKCCEGTASYVDGRCECYGDDKNDLGDECINRIKREAAKRDLDFINCNSAADHLSRCSRPSGRRLSIKDIDRVSRYFMKGGSRRGVSILDSTDCEPSENKLITPADCQSYPDEVEIKVEPVTSVPDYRDVLQPTIKYGEPIVERCYRVKPSSRVDGLSSFAQKLPNFGIQHQLPGLLVTPSASLIPSLPLHHYLHPSMNGPVTHLPSLMNPSLINPHSFTSQIPQYDPTKNYMGGTTYRPIIDPTYMHAPSQNSIIQPSYSSLPFAQASSMGIHQSPTLLSNLHAFLAQQNSVLESLHQQLKGYSMTVPNGYYSSSNFVGAANPNSQRCNCDDDRGSGVIVGSPQSTDNYNNQNTGNPVTSGYTTTEIVDAKEEPLKNLPETAERSRRIPISHNLYGLMRKRELNEKPSSTN